MTQRKGQNPHSKKLLAGIIHRTMSQTPAERAAARAARAARHAEQPEPGLPRASAASIDQGIMLNDLITKHAGRPAKYTEPKKVRSIRLTDTQVAALLNHTGTTTLQEAVETFANSQAPIG
jgi:hypothetical protein